MEIQELKIIWESGHKRPVFAIDEKSLARNIAEENQRLTRSAFFRDTSDVLFGLATCGFLCYHGISFAIDGEYLRTITLVATGLIFLALASYRLAWRIVWRQSQRRYESSLVAQVDRLIDDHEKQISLLKTTKWTVWALLLIIPLFGYNIAVDESNPMVGIAVGGLLATIAAMGVLYSKRHIARKLTPQIEAMVSLRDQINR
ncbi:MAG: hypothetical protein AAFX93_03940 [Verrucomicrobiota bacterium]